MREQQSFALFFTALHPPMATKNNIEHEIQQRVVAFAAELGHLIRQSVFTNLQDILGMGGAAAPAAPAAAAPQAKPGPAKGKPGRPKGSGKGAAKGSAGAASADAIVGFVKQNPGSRIEQIAKALGKKTDALKTPIAKLLESGALSKAGQRRGTNYSIGSGAPAAAPAAQGAAAPAAKKAGKKPGKRGRPAKTMTKRK